MKSSMRQTPDHYFCNLPQYTKLWDSIGIHILHLSKGVNSLSLFNEGQKVSKRPAHWRSAARLFSCHPEGGAAGAARHREFGKERSTKMPTVWMEKRKNGYLYGGAGCNEELYLMGMELVQDNRLQRAFPFRRKNKRSGAARRYGRCCIFVFPCQFEFPESQRRSIVRKHRLPTDYI